VCVYVRKYLQPPGNIVVRNLHVRDRSERLLAQNLPATNKKRP